MNTVKLIGTLPRKPHIIAPASDDKSPVALFTVAARNGDLGGPNYVEIKAFGEEALIAQGQLTERTKVEDEVRSPGIGTKRITLRSSRTQRRVPVQICRYKPATRTAAARGCPGRLALRTIGRGRIAIDGVVSVPFIR